MKVFTDYETDEVTETVIEHYQANVDYSKKVGRERQMDEYGVYWSDFL